MPALEFFASDVLHAEVPDADAPQAMPIAVVNDNTLSSNQLAIELYTGACLTRPLCVVCVASRVCRV